MNTHPRTFIACALAALVTPIALVTASISTAASDEALTDVVRSSQSGDEPVAKQRSARMTVVNKTAKGAYSKDYAEPSAYSANGRYLIYFSPARDIKKKAIRGGNFFYDVKKDRTDFIGFAGSAETPGGSPVFRDFAFMGVSNNGKRVFYEQTGAQFESGTGLFVWDRESGKRTLLADDVLERSSFPDHTGKFVLYDGDESWTPGEEGPPVFRVNVATGQRIKVTEDSSGEPFGRDGRALAITNGGSVVYLAMDTGIVKVSLATAHGEVVFDHRLGSRAPTGSGQRSITSAPDGVSDNGRIYGFGDNAGATFVRDLVTDRTRSLDIPKTDENLDSVSADGQYATVDPTYASAAEELKTDSWLFSTSTGRGEPLPQPSLKPPAVGPWGHVLGWVAGRGKRVIIWVNGVILIWTRT